jgi:Tfp pilus assembly protein PilF
VGRKKYLLRQSRFKRRPAVIGGAVATGVAMFVVAVTVFQFARRAGLADVAQEPAATANAAHYVGSSACLSCHAEEAERWRTSQHHDAMSETSTDTVLGHFDGSTFTYAGITSTFFKRDNRFFIRTDGRDGRLTDFQIKYTFGVFPLQQYLVAFPDGRLQALSIAWDARAKKDGGQRWFHLYPTEHVTHDDELHWTRPAQNWNFMCADCHSTGVRKNYDAGGDRFDTRWSDINVGCEACHGPGSRHLEWAQARNHGARVPSDRGLTAALDERRSVSWTIDVRTGNATRSLPRTTDREIDVCAQCHSRRGQIAEGYRAGAPFLDHYFPALLTSPLYHADGQQQGEVYNWASFLESRMYAKGVTCSDCHEPHNGALRLNGNALCASCHLASKYDTIEHHHHQTGSAGASCVSCHMPASTYMVIDPRRDHSLRVPRPDLSIALGTPNACNSCHADRDARWAAARVEAWFGHEPSGYQRFGPAFSLAHSGTRDRQSELRTIANDVTQPAIARATAFAQIDTFSNATGIDTLARGLHDPNGVVRLGALQSLRGAPPEVRVHLAVPQLSDPLRAVRMEAVSVLAPVPAEQLDTGARVAFERAAREYVDTQQYNADSAEGRVNLGTYFGSHGDPLRGEQELKAAIRLNPFFIPSYVNLADLYRAFGRDADGERTLREGLAAEPASGVLHYALGLALVRLKRIDDAVHELERASALDAGNARFAYAYAVALQSVGKIAAAKATLAKALAAHPDDADVRAALDSVSKDDRR